MKSNSVQHRKPPEICPYDFVFKSQFRRFDPLIQDFSVQNPGENNFAIVTSRATADNPPQKAYHRFDQIARLLCVSQWL